MKCTNLILIICSILITLICLFSTENYYYNYIYLWPLIYSLIVFIKMKFKANSIGINTVMIVSFFKFSIMPLIIVLTDVYANPIFSRGEQSYYQKGIFLELYCFIVLFLTMLFFNKLINGNKSIKNFGTEIDILGHKFLYITLFLLSITLFVFIAYPSKMISFFIINTNDNGNRLEESLSLSMMIIRQIIVIGFNLIFISSCYVGYKKYSMNNNVKFLIIPVFFAIINIGLIVGERRSLQVYTTLCCLIILLYIFREHRKLILGSIGITSFIVLSGMTIYKHLNAFIYGSYSEALRAAIDSGKDATGWGPANTLQAYLYGPQSLATSLKYESIYNIEINQLFFDVARSFIGISFFVKNHGTLLSVKYNNFLFNDISTNTGHIIPNSVYGYIFLGFFLSPLLMCIQGLIIVFLERIFFENKYLEIKFVSLFILFRLSVDIFSNFPQSINIASLTLVSYIIILTLIYYVNILLPKRRRE